MNADHMKAIKIMSELGMSPQAIANDSGWYAGEAPTVGEVKTVLGRRRVQSFNGRRSTNRFLTLNGETRTMREWARIKGFGRNTIAQRLKDGWSVKDALTVPMKVQANNQRCQ